MDTLNPDSLKSLIAQQGKWCVSLYMPIHHAGREQQQDPIRLKNLLAEAEAKLLATGLRRTEVQTLMRPAEELLWNKDFWQRPGEGLALFLTSAFHKIFRLPLAWEEFVSTGTSFYLKPLLPCLGRGLKFYVLALSLNKIRLFEGNADTLGEVDLAFPTSMEDALWTDDPENYLNMHSGSNRMGQGGAGVFHGQGPNEDEKKNIRRFFQLVNDGLRQTLEDRDMPMVLAGVEYILPIFREVSSYPHLLETEIAGNPEKENLRELHAKAWEIVQPIHEESQQRAVEQFEQLIGQNSDLATQDLTTAVQAAVFGQVETIFVPLGVQKWGRYDVEKNALEMRSEPGPDAEDLFDFAARQTLLNSGQVFALPADQMPGGAEVAAILRYAV